MSYFGSTTVWKWKVEQIKYKKKEKDDEGNKTRNETDHNGMRRQDYYCCLTCKTWHQNLRRHYQSNKGQYCKHDILQVQRLESVMKQITRYTCKFKKEGTIPTYCAEGEICVDSIR